MSRTLASMLGLSQQTTKLNIVCLTTSALLSISFLVFLNSLQPFYLSVVPSPPVPHSSLGSVTGTIILCDQVLSLALVFLWGAVADRITVRWVAVLGHLVVGLAFACFSVGRRIFPDVILARMVFAIGASALMTSLGAALASMTAIAPLKLSDSSAQLDVHEDGEGEDTTEQTALLATTEQRQESIPASNPAHAARFAGVLGFASGLGALVAVFFYLRIPTILSPIFGGGEGNTNDKKAIIVTLMIVMLIAFAEAGFVTVGLRIRTDSLSSRTPDNAEGRVDERRLGFRANVKKVARELGRGVRIAKSEPEVALACIAGFVTRSGSILVSAYIPLFINEFYISHSLCNPAKTPSILESPKTCRPAIIQTAILTGTLQLISLLLSPLFGYLSSRYSPSLLLSLSFLFGSISYFAFGFEDPRMGSTWIWVTGMGLSASCGMVSSLGLVARGRSKVIAKVNKGEVGGAVSGVYSFSGGLGILLTGKLGGAFFDKWPFAPFILVGIFSLVLSMFGAMVWLWERDETGSMKSSQDEE
ncbi:hypothetical protein T439DRAFT_325124 [Meredithblackwellia eburnea MCA 4105]